MLDNLGFGEGGFVLPKTFKLTILLTVDNASEVWLDCPKVMADKLERVQNYALRSILKADRKTCTQTMRDELDLLTLRNRRRFLRFHLIFKIVHSFQCAEQLISYLLRRSSVRTRSRGLNDDNLLHLLRVRIAMGQSTFQYSARKIGIPFPHS